MSIDRRSGGSIAACDSGKLPHDELVDCGRLPVDCYRRCCTDRVRFRTVVSCLNSNRTAADRGNSSQGPLSSDIGPGRGRSLLCECRD